MEEIESDEDIYELSSYDIYLEEVKEEQRRLAKELRKQTGEHVPVIATNERGFIPANQLTKAEQLVEFVRCGSDPIYFIENYLTIFDQTQGDAGEIVQFKLFEFQKRLIRDYQGNRFSIANKYRQAGISTCTCAYLAWYVLFNKNRAVAIVANKLETAQNELMSDVVDFIEECPAYLRQSPTKKDTQKLKIYDNGSKLGAFSASKGLRGMTPTLVFWDETAWTDKGDKFWEAAGPTLQTGGRAIFVSTPNGLDAIFYKYFEGARKKIKENIFHAVELWWFNDPRYIRNQETGKVDLEWVKDKGKTNEIRIQDDGWDDAKRIKLMDDGWEATSTWFELQVLAANGDRRKIAQELLCSFLGSGDNFVSEEHLKYIEENTVCQPIAFEYLDKCMHIFEDAEELETYVMSADVSSGHGDDFSCIQILKLDETITSKTINYHGRKKKIKFRTHNISQVAEYYGKVSPSELAEIMYTYGVRYNTAHSIIDVTGGYGTETMNKLFELGYPMECVHYSEIKNKPTRDKFSGYIKQTTKTLPDGKTSKIDLIPGFWIGANRGSVLVEMERSIRMREMDVKSDTLLRELKTFVTSGNGRVADHKRTYHDDAIMALAMGIFVINFELKKYDVSPNKIKKMLDAMMRMDNNTVIKKVKNEDKNESYKYVQEKMNPYGQHSWLMQGLGKNRR